MARKILILTMLLITKCVKTQTVIYDSLDSQIINLGRVEDNNEDFSDFDRLDSLLKGVEIVMLGEQSHGEATTYDTKIKLIKYLHQELDFDILAFESGFYECNKARQMIESGESVRDALGRSVFTLWSATKDFIPLAEYVEKTKLSGSPILLFGFDSQVTGIYSKEHYLTDLEGYLRKGTPSVLSTTDWNSFSDNMSLIFLQNYKGFKRGNPERALFFIKSTIEKIEGIEQNSESEFWIQALKNTYSFLSDIATKNDLRDKQMANNLIWIKEKYPNSKIICWGATSHFLYNSDKVKMKNLIVRIIAGNYYKKHQMMGDYLKEKYQEKIFTVGFTAYQGKYGLFSSNKTIQEPKKGTLEHLLGQSQFNNFLVPFKNNDVRGYPSRPLGNYYMANKITDVMDAVIFNRNMRRPKLDKDFFLKLYPNHRYIRPDQEE